MTIQEKNELVEYLWLHDKGSSMSQDWRQGFLAKLDQMCVEVDKTATIEAELHGPESITYCEDCRNPYCEKCFKICPNEKCV
jgi:hypothetical protein